MARTGRKKKRTHVPVTLDPSKKGPPKSFVFGRGQYATTLKSLEMDLRKLMEPHTASHLKESKRNQLKDFVELAGPMGVSHFLILTATEHSSYLKLAKTPRGPTITMRIDSYSLMSDVAASQQRPRSPPSLWKTSPLIVMNSFQGSEGLKLAATMFQNMFPAINVQSTKLSACQRVVLLNYNKETNLISFRQYGITAMPSGVSKSVKALVGKREIPDLSKFEDVAEFLTKSGYGSESEGEEAAESRVTLAQHMGRGNLKSRQSRVRLQEIGPRMEMEIVKAEEGMCSGQVLYHQHISKSATEVHAKTAEIKTREELREKRRKEQEENVKRKEAKKRRRESTEEGQDKKKRKKKEWWDKTDPEAASKDADNDDDIAHYKREVGEEPDDAHGLTAPVKTRLSDKRKSSGSQARNKSSQPKHPATKSHQQDNGKHKSGDKRRRAKG